MSITIQNLNKHFGNFHALKNINLNVPLSLIHISEPTRPY